MVRTKGRIWLTFTARAFQALDFPTDRPRHLGSPAVAVLQIATGAEGRDLCARIRPGQDLYQSFYHVNHAVLEARQAAKADSRGVTVVSFETHAGHLARDHLIGNHQVIDSSCQNP